MRLAFRSGVVLLSVLAAAASSAQVSVGLRAGFSGARFTPREGTISPSSFRSGFTAGIFAEVPVYRSVTVRPEVLYVQKGTRRFSSDYSFDGAELEEVFVDLRVDYVGVPLLVHVTGPAGGRFRVGLMAGPAVAFRTTVRAGIGRYVNGESDPFPPGSIAVVAATAPVDVGLTAGGDVAFGPVALDVRYTAGLTEADAARPSARNGAVAVALSYRHTW